MLKLTGRKPKRSNGTWSRFKKLFLEFFYHVIIYQNMKERLKDLKQRALSVCKYKDRFDELVEYFSDLSDKDKQFFFVTRLLNSIKYDVKALKPYTLEKIYSMTLTFETKNVELAKEKRFSFDVSRKDPSREKKIRK